MRRIRFSIASLLGLVLFVAIAVAALREANDLWDSGLFTLAVSLLLASVLLAAHRTDQKRSFWLGFALVGWSYLVASLVPPVESRLLTTKALSYLDSKVADRVITLTWTVATTGGSASTTTPVQAVAFSPDGQTLALSRQGTSGPMVRLWNAATGKILAGANGTTENFVRIGHSLLALVIALGGGHLSRWLLERERRQRAGEPGVSTVPAPEAGAA
jgi:WD40 repeat protein